MFTSQLSFVMPPTPWRCRAPIYVFLIYSSASCNFLNRIYQMYTAAVPGWSWWNTSEVMNSSYDLLTFPL